MNDRDIVDGLNFSDRVGQLYPVLLDKHGNVVDGLHRLEELGELYVKAGVKRGTELARKISEVTGMSFRWVMMYLPDKLKERLDVGRPSRSTDSPNIKVKLQGLQLNPFSWRFLLLSTLRGF